MVFRQIFLFRHKRFTTENFITAFGQRFLYIRVFISPKIYPIRNKAVKSTFLLRALLWPFICSIAKWLWPLYYYLSLQQSFAVSCFLLRQSLMWEDSAVATLPKREFTTVANYAGAYKRTTAESPAGRLCRSGKLTLRAEDSAAYLFCIGRMWKTNEFFIPFAVFLQKENLGQRCFFSNNFKALMLL